MPFLDALWIRLSGDAIHSLTFSGPFLSEPTKAWLLKRRGLSLAEGFAGTLTAAVMNLVVGAAMGTAGLGYLLRHGALPAPAAAAAVALVCLNVGFLLAVRRRRRRAVLSHRHRHRLARPRGRSLGPAEAGYRGDQLDGGRAARHPPRPAGARRGHHARAKSAASWRSCWSWPGSSGRWTSPRRRSTRRPSRRPRSSSR
ncbi:MAG: lysylphosphatidylglycerol synthase domain-containing protein [Comamonadaceae bacterium]|nr:lysylphosphatidylglycerol synthase domain-containing protein [Comamonadaceae bacterium]